MRKISELINCNLDIDITGITDDSRKVKPGYLFVATKGFNVDHYNFIDDAILRGCSFVVCDRKIDKNIPFSVVDNINDYFIDLCSKYYGVDLDNFHFIGVTGTDGKTTTASIIKALMEEKCAYLGTNGLSVFDKNFSTNNTTPCVSELYQDLKIVQDNSCTNVVMEVSSEALLHERVKNFRFDVVAFTNITGDHLNVHKTFDNYVKCKLKLLNLLKEDGIVVVNGDDVNLQKIECKKKYTFGFNSDNLFTIKDVKYFKDRTEFYVNYDEKLYFIVSPFIGKYNVYNLVEAIIVCYLQGIPFELLIDRVRNLLPISGRGEFLNFGQNYDIVLDYAHTLNGIASVYEAFKDYETIITVTGCAGGREKEKRKEIGKLVIENSDIAIFTMDDPRYENVDDIIDQMAGDLKDYIRIVDRKSAINYALSIAPKDSVVLILGKGRDNYMAIGDDKIEYNDYNSISSFFN